MKKKIINCLLSTVAVFILFKTGNTQVNIRSMDASTDIIQVVNKSALISNLVVIDSIVPNDPGQTRDYNTSLLHLAAFEIELGSDAAKDILKSLYAAMLGQELPNLTLSKLNAQRRIAEQRDYSSIVVKEIVLPELRSDSREPAKAKVTIQAEHVVYDNSGGSYASFSPDRNSKVIPGSFFSLDMGNLPAQRVMRISNIKILPSSAAASLYFSIDIPSADAREWNNWLNGNGGPNQPAQAIINLRDERAQQQFSVQLSQVEIVSISAMSNTAGAPKVTIGLRTNTPPAIL